MANVACVSSTPSSSGYTVLLQAPGKSSIQSLCSTTLPSSLNSASLCEARQVASLTVSSHNCHWRRRGPHRNYRGTLQHPPHANAEMTTVTEAEEALSPVEEDEANVRDISRGILPFKKYQGLGNDFILVDNRDSSQPKISPEQAITLCDRNFGIGADGVIFALPGVKGSDYTMRIFNSDGSEPEMCGNGIRCMARFVAELENNKETRSYNIHTLAGLIIPKLRDDGQVEVDMGPPILNAADVPTHLPSNKDGFVIKEPLLVEGRKWLVTCVSMGNPHCVIFASEESEALDVNSLSLQSIGPHFEHHKVFPARTNTEFVQVLSPSHLRMRVWERGAGATLACGTGACAVVVAAVLEGRTSKKCTVDLPGGPLEIEWRENNHVYMTGPAKAVFEGRAFL